MTAPHVTRLGLPFQPLKLVATNKSTSMVFGMDTVNLLPVVAVVDDAGHLVREIDLSGGPGSAQADLAGMLQHRSAAITGVADRLAAVVQFTHTVQYRNSMLMLDPGPGASIIRIRSDGEVSVTRLRLPQGIDGLSLVPSNRDWYVLASDDTAHAGVLLLKIDPSDGKVLQIIHAVLPYASDGFCAYDGNYLALHRAGNTKKRSGDVSDARASLKNAQLKVACYPILLAMKLPQG